MSKHKVELVTAVILLVGGMLTLANTWVSNNRQPEQPATTQPLPAQASTANSTPTQDPSVSEDTLVETTSRFYCSLQADPIQGGEVYTVLYQHDQGIKPWLRMVRSMGGDWNTLKRCEEIARRLDIFRTQGLIKFDYRKDPSTPKQYVLCAKTKLSGNSCDLVLTLMPEDDPEKALHEVAGALLPGTEPSYQCSQPQNCTPANPLEISLDNQLAQSDRQ